MVTLEVIQEPVDQKRVEQTVVLEVEQDVDLPLPLVDVPQEQVDQALPTKDLRVVV
jgi:hypothetical protein